MDGSVSGDSDATGSPMRQASRPLSMVTPPPSTGSRLRPPLQAFGRWWLLPIYAGAGLGGLSAGVAFGLQAGGGAALAIVAGLCMAVFCTILVDAWADRLQTRGREHVQQVIDALKTAGFDAAIA